MMRGSKDDPVVMSDLSSEEEDQQEHEDEEELHVMDPSDPRAHKKQTLRVHPTNDRQSRSKRAATAASGSRWDSDEGNEDLGEPIINVDDGDKADDGNQDAPIAVEDEQLQQEEPKASSSSSKPQVKLSNWAKSRFLVKRSERPVPVLEDPPLEPLNDFILSDFGSRFRGAAGAVEKMEKEAWEQDEPESPERALQVGKPLFSTESSMSQHKKFDNDDTPSRPVTPSDNKDAAAAAGNRKQRRENRYFITDLATKCFNCGQIGHMSSVCMNDKVFKPCYYCGLRGHLALACPHLPCNSCLQLGHEAKNCSNQRLRLHNCSICGRVGHDDEDCEHSDSHVRDVSCMVCVEPGHLHCVPVPAPEGRRRVYCPNCAGNHVLDDCREYVAPTNTSFTARQYRSVMKCFTCDKTGHISAECPQRTGYLGNSCFACGKQGHYSSDCPNKGNNNNRQNQSGRKRGRDYYDESELYNNEDGEDDDESYYYVPRGGSNNSNKASYKNSSYKAKASTQYRNSYARLDAPLSSNRGNNNNNGGGNYYNRRNGGGGNGGGRWR